MTFEREHKYVVIGEVAQAFVDRCNGHLAVQTYDAARPVAYTRTAYLDTDDLALERSSGPWTRRVRVREYAAAATLDDPPVLTGAAMLELKRSCGLRRRKWRVQMAPAELRELLAGGVRARDLPMRTEAISGVRGLLRPVIGTWYRRLSFAGRGVRITVDEGLSFCLPPAPGDAGAPAEPEHILGRGPTAVLEVKLRADMPDWLVEAMAPLGRPTGFSKFRAGIAAREPSKPRATTLALPTIRVA